MERGTRGSPPSAPASGRETLFFVPPSLPGEPCPVELWELTLTNTGDRPVTLRTFSYAELSFTDAMADLTNLDWTGHVVERPLRRRAEGDPGDDAVPAHHHALCQ